MLIADKDEMIRLKLTYGLYITIGSARGEVVAFAETKRVTWRDELNTYIHVLVRRDNGSWAIAIIEKNGETKEGYMGGYSSGPEIWIKRVWTELVEEPVKESLVLC